MTEKLISSVDISIGSNMYGRIPDLPNTPSHVLAEFIDNAIQSYRDNRAMLLAKQPDYRLAVNITLEWDAATGNPARIVVSDNAGGINTENYTHAFKLAVAPKNNQGLNEFGMGLKTAALWLGEVWSVRTSALGEGLSRTIRFDLNEVLVKHRETLNVISEEEDADAHYTEIVIESPTRQFPSRRSLEKISEELSSIYRKFLRADEVDIYLNGEKLSFEESEILCAPFVRNPEGGNIYWKKNIDFNFKKYHATGFIAILKNINSTKNGLVLLRRGRVVYGANADGRYFPKSLCGSVGTFLYKRIFGELELEGFDVAFNKNDLQDKENLEAMIEALRDVIHTKEFDLYTQAQEYRLDNNKKRANEIIRAHNKNQAKYGDTKIETRSEKNNTASCENDVRHNSNDVGHNLNNVRHEKTVKTYDDFDEKYTINGKEYLLHVDFIDGGNDLVWLDVSEKAENKIACKIKMNHVFFECFKKQDKAVVTILKTMALAKFTAKEDGNDTTAEFFENFNEYIKQAKV